MYNTIIDPALRPTIVLLLGEAGNHVYDHLMRLTPTLDPIVHSSLAVLRYSPEHEGLSARLRSVPVDADDDYRAEDQPGRYDPNAFGDLSSDERVMAEGLFIDLMVRAICDVQDVRVVEGLRRSGYTVPDPMAQIVLVGRADDPYLEEALRAVRAGLAEARHTLGAMIDLEAPIYCALADYRTTSRGFTDHARVSDHDVLPAFDQQHTLTDLYQAKRGRAGRGDAYEDNFPTTTASLRHQAQANVATAKMLSRDGEATPDPHQLHLPSASFLFLYSRMRQDHRATMDESLIDYIMAEAVFALCATGLPLSPSMGEVAHSLPGISATKDRLGSLGACMVRFPQVEAVRYCIAMLGGEVLTSWSEQEVAGKRVRMSDDERATRAEALRQSAYRFVEETLLPWMRHDILADFPDSGEDGWPDLGTFVEQTRLAGEALGRTRDRLEPLISRGEIDRHMATRDPEYRARRTPDEFARLWDEVTTQAWLEFTDQQRTQLATVLRVAYLAVGAEVDRFLDRQVDDLWLDPEQGWEAAGEYVGALADALYTIAIQTLLDDRIAADARYQALLRRYEERTREVRTVASEGAPASASRAIDPATWTPYTLNEEVSTNPATSVAAQTPDGGVPDIPTSGIPIDTGVASQHDADEHDTSPLDLGAYSASGPALTSDDPDTTVFMPRESSPIEYVPAEYSPGTSAAPATLAELATDDPNNVASFLSGSRVTVATRLKPTSDSTTTFSLPIQQHEPPAPDDVVEVPASEAREERLLSEMSQLVAKRLHEQQIIVPAIGMGLVGAPAIILLTLAQTTRWWPFSLGLVTGVTALVLAALAVIILALWMRARRRTRQALEAHVALMAAVAARRTELVEEQLRVCVVNQALANARDMREHLRAWPNRIERMADQYREEARNTSDDLFSGPAGYHDVLIANGTRLMPPDTHTQRQAESAPQRERSPLWPIYQRFTDDRSRQPAERWHSSLDGIVDALRDQFRSGNGGVVRISEGDFRALVRRFLRDHFREYLNADVGNLAAALDPHSNPGAHQQWAEALEHAVPPHSQPGADLISVAGQRGDVLTSNTVGGDRKLYRLLTRPSEKHKTWLLATTLRRGGITL